MQFGTGLRSAGEDADWPSGTSTDQLARMAGGRHGGLAVRYGE